MCRATVCQSHLASPPRATGSHTAPDSVTAFSTQFGKHLVKAGCSQRGPCPDQAPHHSLTRLLKHYQVAQKHTMSILHKEKFKITLCSTTHQWKPQGIRNPTLKFSFKYLHSAVLVMNVFKHSLEQSNENLLYKATNLKRKTSFPQNQTFFLGHFQTIK